MACRAGRSYEFDVSTRKTREWQQEVAESLRALGGEATLGDLVSVTGLFRWEVVSALDGLLASERAHVRVSSSGDVVYHLDPRARRLSSALRPWRPSPRSAEIVFDRRTLRLIRNREGVLSMAELVEHTGLPLAEAELEMARLAESWGGVPHTSWDGHVVWAFPELMSSTHGRFGAREPRPAWVHADDPMERAAARRRGWLGRILAAVASHRLFRFRSPRPLRRYVLGYVIQTALAGKGVVSLDRAVAYLQARAGKRAVSRRAVEVAIRRLAAEFDAPVTEIGGELFFGFRNVKRQFLASEVVRRRMRLARTAEGRTVFDTADTPHRAGARDLEAFDQELFSPRLPLQKNHDGAWLAD